MTDQQRAHVGRLIAKPLVQLTVAEAIYLALALDRDDVGDELEQDVIALVEQTPANDGPPPRSVRAPS